MFELEQQILDLINASGLPLDAKVMVLKDLYREALKTYEDLKNKANVEEPAAE